MKVHSKSIHFSADSKLKDFIEKRLTKLEQFYDRIIEANVVMKLENSGQVKDKVVEIRMSIPGNVLYVKEINKSFEAATDSAAEALKRQLIKSKERQRSR